VLTPRSWCSFRTRGKWVAIMVIGWPLVALLLAVVIPRIAPAFG
jgi:hypothetical protein